ncbi:MAG: hypothetical protein ACO3GZ_12240 [Ilumatobacteraceae bacterium]
MSGNDDECHALVTKLVQLDDRFAEISFHLLIKYDAEAESFIAEALPIQPTEQNGHGSGIVAQTISGASGPMKVFGDDYPPVVMVCATTSTWKISRSPMRSR